jgi:asparagine synthase (glutamine-hydrolysing)
LKRRNGTGKWILREAISGLVPASVFQHPKKGFGVPLVRWFRAELSHRLDTLSRAERPVYRYVDHQSVVRLVREHRTGRRDHSQMLWRVLVLDLWLQALARGELAEPLGASSLQVA